MDKALITGITGQDGAYLAKSLLDDGYEVFGGYRRGSVQSTWRLDELGITNRVQFVALELMEYSNIHRMIEQVQPTEIYNLAANSYVQLSFEQPTYSAEVNALGALRILEAIRYYDRGIRFYQASSSEMFGRVTETPQSEMTPFRPCSPYGAAKLHAHWVTTNYREAYEIFAVNGILFNHESPMRGVEFVTRKITSTLARIKQGEKMTLMLGNLSSKRDWGFAGDYVEGMRLMMAQKKPDDYVLATGETHTVRDFLTTVLDIAEFNWEWDKHRRVINKDTGKPLVDLSHELYRPVEVDILVGDASKAKENLGWTPTVKMQDLAAMMYHADFDRIARGLPIL
jgi:GDPmannose 4,6-dehydratase